MAESDNAFINKLENVAGVTNENFLSDTEILRGRILLAKALDRLSNRGSPQSPLALPDHIERLSIALAPHKRLPPEILEHIFCSDLHSAAIVRTPPVLSRYPWVLGRVCSSWRRISRSIPDLWYTLINFGTELTETDPDYDVASVRDLRYATEILPEIAFLSLYVHEGTRVPIRALAPYLYRLDRLEWNVTSSPEQAGLEAFPPGSLSRLQSLKITTESPDEAIECSISYPDLFGKSSQLQRLSLISNDASFLLSDIPWSQLRSLSLDSLFSTSIHSSWPLLGRHHPFQQMRCLEKLILDLSADLFRIVLNYGFPWHQLKAFFVHWSDQAQDIVLIMETLQECHSLTHFFFSSKLPSDFIYEPENSFTLPSLGTLELQGNVPLPMIKSLISSGSLHSLELQCISLQDFYVVIRHCPRLTQLTSCLTESPPIAADADTIILSHLTCLCMFFDDASLSFPTWLVAPLLTSLRFHSKSGSFPLHMTAAFIINSNIKLHKFECTFGEDSVQYPSPESLRELLSLLDSCSEVYTSASIFPGEILDEIGSGSLLPEVKTFSFDASSPDSILTTMRRRLEQEMESNHVRLREINAHAPQETINADEYLEANLKELEITYGVKFTVYPLFIFKGNYLVAV